MNQIECRSAISEKIRQFVFDEFPNCKRKEFKDNTSLIEAGIIDSLGMLDLVTFVEEGFGIEVEDLELIPENFESVEALSTFVDSKQGN